MLISQAQANEVKTVPPVNSVCVCVSIQENTEPQTPQSRTTTESSEFTSDFVSHFLRVKKVQKVGDELQTSGTVNDYIRLKLNVCRPPRKHFSTMQMNVFFPLASSPLIR